MGGTKSVFAVILAFCILSSMSPAMPGETGASGSGSPSVSLIQLPREYGEIIYRCNEKSPNQVFIIGMSHRDAATRLNGENTPRAQAEAYKIGEWLVRNENLELLLPEGFFAKKMKGDGDDPRSETKPAGKEAMDIRIIERRLGDDNVFMNAEMLLGEYYLLRIRQVEDRKFYEAVRENAGKLDSCRKNSFDYLSLKSELDYLQERRTAAMLQRIPEMVDDEYSKGGIRSKKALFTIGMNHIYEILKYLKASRIAIYSPLFAAAGIEDYTTDLNLLRENYGITIIIPRILADDKEVLEKTRLDTVLTNRSK